MFRLTLLTMFVTCAVVAGCGSQPSENDVAAGKPSTVAQSAVTPTELEVLRTMALEAAEKAGDTHPLWGQVVETTEQAANLTAFGTQVAGNRNVFLVQVRGEFVAHLASRPRGATAPQGEFMILVYERGSYDDVAFGVGGHDVNLSLLGPVTSLEIG